ASANETGAARVGHIKLADQTFTVKQAACTWIVPRTGDNLDGGTATPFFTVTTPTGCAWAATSDADWLKFRNGVGRNSSNGNGAVCYAASANETGAARVGHIKLADLIFTVKQAACTWMFPRTGDNLDGGTATPFFTVTAPTGCAWTATSDADWLTFRNGVGCNSSNGNGAVCYAASANVNGNPRTGHIAVGDQTFTVTQSACAQFLTTTSSFIGAAGGSSFVGVTTATGCPWSAATTDNWIAIRNDSGCPSSGTRNGSVCYSVSVNTSGTRRTGTITIGSTALRVTQDSCGILLSPTSGAFGASSSSATVTVTTTPASCPWTAASNSDWITLTPNGSTCFASRQGPGSVCYQVAQNDTGRVRIGSITIGGQDFPVT